jgi:uncharacterized repeat protein (TIGR01451 family)
MRRFALLSVAVLVALTGCRDDQRPALGPDGSVPILAKINSNDFYQCQTGNPRNVEAPPGPGCNWISGVLNRTHNIYYEDDVIPQSLALNEAVGKTRVILEYGFRKGGSDATGDLTGPFNGNYDLMAHYAAGTGPNNPCTNGRLGPFCTGTSFKPDIPTATLAIPGPDDSRVSTSALTPTELAAYQSAFTRYITQAGKSNHLEILGATPGSIVLTSLSFSRSGDATTARMVFEFQAAQADVLMLWGMHFAYGGDWNALTPDGYWHGASGQSGSPFHTKLIEVRTDIQGSNYSTGKVLNNGAMAINVSGNVVIRNPELGITKSVSSETVSAGEPFSWTITLTNSGDGAANGAEIIDPLVAIPGYTYSTTSANCSIVDGELRCGPTTLAAGASLVAVVNATATGTLTAGTCGAFPNTATGRATGQPDVTAGASITIQCPAVSLTKVADAASVSAGSQVGFTITVSNAGPGTATGVTVTDNLPEGFTWTIDPANLAWSIDPTTKVLSFGPATLAAGASNSVHVVAPTTSANCGVVPNTAMASVGNGTDPPHATDQVTINCPTLNLLKATPTPTLEPGQLARYTITLTNMGPGIASGVTITDQLPGAGTNWSIDPAVTGCSISGAAGSQTLNCSFATLAMGAVIINLQSLTTPASCPNLQNLATATAGAGVTVSGSPASATIVVNCAPALSIEKATNGQDADTAPGPMILVGSTVTWTYVVTNTGNVPLSNVAVTDNRVSSSAISCTGTPGGSNVIPSLAVGGSATCTATGTAVAGQYSNIGTATSGSISDTDPSHYFGAAPAIELIKTGVLSANGSTITYSFTVRNTGNVTLTNVTLTDPLPGIVISGGPIASLAPGASDATTFTGSYTVTQADRDRGHVDNTATACGNPPTGPPVCDPDDARVTIPQTPSIAVTKSANPLTYVVGTVITYSFTVTNNGNVTLSNVTLVDDKLGTIAGCAAASLAPGASTNCTATHTATQADVDAGSIHNVATGTGYFNGQPYTDTDDATITANQNRALSLVKTATPQTYSAVGDVISYNYLVTNTGNVSLAGPVTVVDDKTTVTCPPGGLAVGASMNCSAQYTITQADLNAGSVTNIARAHANGTYSNYDDETVTAVLGALQIRKLVNNTTDLGGRSFTFVVERCASSDGTSCTSPTAVAGSPFTVNGSNNPRTISNLVPAHYRVTETSTTGYIVIPSPVQIVQVTAAHTPANPAVVEFNNMVIGDVCEGNQKPRELYLLYRGNGTAFDYYPGQSGSELIVRVDDDATINARQHPVTIRTYDHQDKVIDTYTGVQKGREIVFKAARSNQLIPSRAGFRVFLNGANINQPAQAIEHVQFHSSCSQPLGRGYEFGSFLLTREVK